MSTGFEILRHNPMLREHWLRRAVAALFDLVLLLVVAWFISYFLLPAHQMIASGVLSGVLLFIYSAAMEGALGYTIGKRAAELEVRTVDPKAGQLSGALIRSFPKIFWYLFLPLDALVGLAMRGDPRRRWSDRLASTVVVHTDTAGPYGQVALDRAPPPPFPPAPEIKPMPRTPDEAGERCRSCGGTMSLLEDGRYRCSKCGLIQ
ncbi:MAG: RDD family protein [Candidatus Thermoplasmatota archaeon]